MRLFIATDLPESLIPTIADVGHRLYSGAKSARWVRPESMHLTLKFLGETAIERVEAVDEQLRQVRAQPFKVKLSGVGFFPSARVPRVFWMGIESQAFRELAEQVDKQTLKLGFPSEKRPFSPHLTLARSRRDHRLEHALVEESSRFSGREFATFTTDRFGMYQSIQTPDGAEYERMFEYTLVRNRLDEAEQRSDY